MADGNLERCVGEILQTEVRVKCFNFIFNICLLSGLGGAGLITLPHLTNPLLSSPPRPPRPPSLQMEAVLITLIGSQFIRT